MQKFLATMLLLCLPTIAGCAPGKGDDWTPVAIIDLAATRCPEPDVNLKREFSRVTPAPRPDAVAVDGKPAVSLGALKAKTDELRLAEQRKNRAGQRALREYELCRGVGT